jgi:hypothetical protein
MIVSKLVLRLLGKPKKGATPQRSDVCGLYVTLTSQGPREAISSCRFTRYKQDSAGMVREAASVVVIAGGKPAMYAIRARTKHRLQRVVENELLLEHSTCDCPLPELRAATEIDVREDESNIVRHSVFHRWNSGESGSTYLERSHLLLIFRSIR